MTLTHQMERSKDVPRWRLFAAYGLTLGAVGVVLLSSPLGALETALQLASATIVCYLIIAALHFRSRAVRVVAVGGMALVIALDVRHLADSTVLGALVAIVSFVVVFSTLDPLTNAFGFVRRSRGHDRP